MAKSKLKEYWEIMKIPVYILVGWSVLGLIVAAISFDLYATIFSQAAEIIITIAAFGFVGYTAVKDHKKTAGEAFKIGAMAGIITGFAGGVISIIMSFAAPEIIEFAIQTAVSSGAARGQVEGLIKIGIYIGVITGPIVNGIIGGLLSLIGGLIGKKL